MTSADFETPTPTPAVPLVEVAIGTDITIRFEAKRCIHARFCVLQAPMVFLANVAGEWIFPDNLDADHLVAVAENCPSGAITYSRHDGRKGETAPPVNLAVVRENGPYAIRAKVRADKPEGADRMTLCRCGASKNKPFCDGSHKEAGFLDSGEPMGRVSEPLTNRNGEIDVTPVTDGPLVITGPLEICSGTGRTIDRTTSVALCRCGGSSSKPYCDGTHARIGFIAP